MAIEVADYDDGWPGRAEVACAELRDALPGLFTAMRGRLFYRRDEGGTRAYHLHIVTADSWPARNEWLLRDYLRTHPAQAQRYAGLKRDLA